MTTHTHATHSLSHAHTHARARTHTPGAEKLFHDFGLPEKISVVIRTREHSAASAHAVGTGVVNHR